jgi:5-deoxy-glucuronate isomerase
MQFHLSSGAAADGPYRVVVTPERAGWAYSGLRVLELPPGGVHRLDSGPEELLVLPLSGGCVVRCQRHGAGGQSFNLAGRPDVFAGVTDFVYVPPAASVEIMSAGGGRFALPSARVGEPSPAPPGAGRPGAGRTGAGRFPARYGAAGAVPVELRGAGQASRQVHNFCAPEAFEADRLIAVEVLTPGGNWSSYPPHKHDEARDGECALEELYYFEVRGAGGVGYQRVYPSTAERPIDVLAEVRTGDVVLIPYGYHGPSMAAPGYDLYYLNVMAGPGAVREWRFRDDPVHAWIRSSWSEQAIDPRLPLGARSPDRERMSGQPGSGQPGSDEPGSDEPGSDEPGSDEPGSDEPGSDEPGSDEPTGE